MIGYEITNKYHHAKRLAYNLLPTSSLYRIYGSRKEAAAVVAAVGPDYDIDRYDFVSDDMCAAIEIVDRRLERMGAVRLDKQRFLQSFGF